MIRVSILVFLAMLLPTSTILSANDRERIARLRPSEYSTNQEREIALSRLPYWFDVTANQDSTSAPTTLEAIIASPAQRSVVQMKLRFLIDSLPQESRPALSVRLIGSAEVFLDGVRVFVGGLPSSDSTTEISVVSGGFFSPAPLLFPLTASGIHELTVHYSYHADALRGRSFIWFTPPPPQCDIRLLPDGTSAREHFQNDIALHGLRTFSMGVLCMIALLHILYFALSPRERYGPAVGIYSACTAFMAWMSIIARSDSLSIPTYFVIRYIVIIIFPLLFLSLQAALHAAVLQHIPRRIAGYALGLGVVYILVATLFPNLSPLRIIYPLAALATVVEIVFVLQKGFHSGNRGSRTLLIGSIFTAISWGISDVLVDQLGIVTGVSAGIVLVFYYLAMPVSLAVFSAERIAAANKALERQNEFLEEEVQRRTLDLKTANEQSEQLLLNVLPAGVAERLRRGETRIADRCYNVTVLFADIVGFSALAEYLEPVELVDVLDEIFSGFDAIAERFGLEKIKTIGDSYMLVAGVPEERTDHCEATALAALAMQEQIVLKNDVLRRMQRSLQVRIGFHTGDAVAGVIGKKKFSYDLWGDTVNTASRMESHGEAGKIHVTEECFNLLKHKFTFEERGEIEVKGKGVMRTWFLVGSTL